MASIKAPTVVITCMFVSLFNFVFVHGVLFFLDCFVIYIILFICVNSLELKAYVKLCIVLESDNEMLCVEFTQVQWLEHGKHLSVAYQQSLFL